MKRDDPRLDVYLYWKQLMEHINYKTDTFFNGDLIYPRQFEIHLPSDHKSSCNLHCPHCAGKLFDHTIGTWEREGLALLDKLKGKIPFHIYGGAYTEPIMNPYFMAFMNMTKKYNNHFGIHTNGVHMAELENMTGWLTELNRLASDETDYLSISIDAGFPWSWAKTKGTKNKELFWQIIQGVEDACNIREQKGKTHAIRLCYLISPSSGNIENFQSMISIAKDLGVDSLRFSIPFGNYNQSFDKIRSYKEKIELPGDKKYYNILEPHLSRNKTERPYIFYTGPEFTDIERFDFKSCIYGYYQITFGADGYAYKCSTSATPTAQQCRVGEVTDDLDVFNKMIIDNYNPAWNAQKECFSKGVRCNRMALEINTQYAADKGGSK